MLRTRYGLIVGRARSWSTKYLDRCVTQSSNQRQRAVVASNSRLLESGRVPEVKLEGPCPAGGLRTFLTL